MRRTFVLLAALLTLTGCSAAFGAEPERRSEIPTEQEVYEFLHDTLGVDKNATITATYNLLKDQTPTDGRNFHGVDALYKISSKTRGVDFEVRMSYDYDSWLSTGYHYYWSTNYDRTVLENYLESHPLPAGMVYDINKGYNSRYDFLDGHEPMIYFECEDETHFEQRLNELDVWIQNWTDHEHSYMTNNRGLGVRVVFKQLPSIGYANGMLGGVQMGHNDGSTTAGTFKRDMRKEYNSRRELDKTK